MSPLAADRSRRFSSPSGGKLEFHSTSDDAWHVVRAVLKGKKLVLKHENFDNDHDDVIELRSFSDLEELREFEARFRSLSRKLRDSECKKLAKGTAVCVSHSLHDQDSRFYDAVVDEVNREKHSFSSGKEVFKCAFTVVWQSGPWKGCLASKRIENICMAGSEKELDHPALLQFLTMARDEIDGASSEEASRNDQSACGTPQIEVSLETEGSGEDTDFGRHTDRYALVVENIDKDASPSALKDFIHQETSLLVRVHILPILYPESFARAVIVVGSGKQLEELCKFLDSPNHIVITESGRPLVVTEKNFNLDAFMMPMENLSANGLAGYLQGQDRSLVANGGLRVVKDGSVEYNAANEMKDVFVEFSDHQRLMFQDLAAMEKEIMEK